MSGLRKHQIKMAFIQDFWDIVKKDIGRVVDESRIQQNLEGIKLYLSCAYAKGAQLWNNDKFQTHCCAPQSILVLRKLGFSMDRFFCVYLHFEDFNMGCLDG